MPLISQSPAWPVTILLVDDDADCRELVAAAVLSVCPQARLLHAGSAEQAMEMLRGQVLPALIYMDVQMPGMGGAEAVRLIKQDPRLREIPVVMLSGLADENTIRLAARHGANSYTLKPPRALDLLESVARTTEYWLCVNRLARIA